MKKPLRKIVGVLTSFLIILLAFPIYSATTKPDLKNSAINTGSIAVIDSSALPVDRVSRLYDDLNLGMAGLSKSVFEMAMKGYEALLKEGKIQNGSVLTVIDFSKPSTQKRLFVLDLDNMKLLYKTYVAHGRNSGKLYANRFSNKPESHMSSLGFYVTGNTYFGEHGYSLKLNGEEKGINDKAAQRAIVMHSADYASSDYAERLGYLGRSYGCPALPREVSKPIIETIKDGSCMFVYGQSDKYVAKSQLL